eukprot:TRINITY_DN5573_c0_g1_i1.p1 TRINITY_DN5573_c0_g1~~TRINITY_DN5573_c0_g1_i1.p1  ORF type:complete len:1295 (-),score=324.79 TRINITY_DN5573_c0_g1_i1:44-3928(-)
MAQGMSAVPDAAPDGDGSDSSSSSSSEEEGGDLQSAVREQSSCKSVAVVDKPPQGTQVSSTGPSDTSLTPRHVQQGKCSSSSSSSSSSEDEGCGKDLKEQPKKPALAAAPKTQPQQPAPAAAPKTQPQQPAAAAASKTQPQQPAPVAASKVQPQQSAPAASSKTGAARLPEGAVVRTWALRAQGSRSNCTEVSSSSDGESISSSSSEEEEDSEISDLDGEEDVDLEIEETGGIMKDLITKQDEVPPDPAYPGNWVGSPAPGSNGFNRFAAKVMWNARVAREKRGAAKDTSGCPPLQPHQEAVAFLLHPQSPVSRLLVDHPTGSGKTREMIRVLDNFFLDPRPKVPIFPKEPVCRNFYVELLRWPSRYRDFFACLRPQDAARAAGLPDMDWRVRRAELWDLSELPETALKELIVNMRDVLEMKGWFYMGRMRRSRREAFLERFPNELVPGAPLRALRYTSAGGRHANLRLDGWPMSALLKVAFDRNTAGGNPYSNKVVIMDEVHNLVRVQTQFGEQLARLRTMLAGARGTVLAGFTGTPILNEAAEGRQLLDIIKGAFAPRGDGGFLSSFPMRPAGLFPSSLPRGIPDSSLTPNLRRQFVRRVTLTAETLKRYDTKRQKGLPERRLRAYCNLCVHFGSFHSGKNGSKARVLADMQSCAPKLFAIAKEVAENPEKALILIARSSGLEALLEHLRELALTNGDFNVATMEELAEFNSPGNLRGERFRVMVADAATCSEGVSFFAVRRVHLADVPATPSALVQSVGRAIRMYGHRGLPQEEQTVTTQLWVAGLPRWLRSPLGAWTLRAQRRRGEPQDMVSGARRVLRRLLAAGVRDFETLKERLDACGSGKALESGEKAPLTSTQAAAFLEQMGLWEEAKGLRIRAQKGDAQKGRTRRMRLRAPSKAQTPKSSVKGKNEASSAVKTKEVKVEVKEEEMPKVKLEEVKVKKELPDPSETLPRVKSQSDLENSLLDKMKMEPGESGGDGNIGVRSVATPQHRPLDEKDELSLAAFMTGSPAGEGSSKATPSAPSRAVSSASAAPQQLFEAAWERDPLVKAMQGVFCATNAAEAQELMFLSPWSADEEALQNLAQRSREFVPALAELRKKAVDRAILLASERQKKVQVVKEEQEKDVDSSGESSALEFAVSDSNGEDGATQPKQPPSLVLPVGWRTEAFYRKGRECREFVDPTGRRYRTMADARKAINAERTRENIAKQMKIKYAAALAKKAQERAAAASSLPEGDSLEGQLPKVISDAASACKVEEDQEQDQAESMDVDLASQVTETSSGSCGNKRLRKA